MYSSCSLASCSSLEASNENTEGGNVVTFLAFGFHFGGYHYLEIPAVSDSKPDLLYTAPPSVGKLSSSEFKFGKH